MNILVFPIILFAQMQNQITESSERSTPIRVHDVNSIHVEKCNNNKIISLCSVRVVDTVYTSYKHSVFSLSSTATNNIEISATPNFDSVINFRIFEKDLILFCGIMHDTSSNSDFGFIAVSKVADLFGGGPCTRHIIANTSAVYDLEVYRDPANGRIKAAALGKTANNTYCIIDYDIFNNNTGSYTIYETSNILYRISQTDKYLAVVYSLASSWQEFGITCHDKGNIAHYMDQSYKYAYGGVQQGYNYPLANTPTFLIDRDYYKNNIYVATVLQRQTRPDISGNECSIGVYKIDLVNNLNLDFTQILPTSDKSFVWDMEFSEKYNILYLLADPTLSWSQRLDVVCNMDMSATSNYTCTMTAPNSSTGAWHRMNNIALYDNDYYIVAGRSLNDNLYWFDKYIPGQNPLCASKPKADIYFDPPIPNGPAINYIQNTYPKIWNQIPLYNTTIQDTVICHN